MKTITVLIESGNLDVEDIPSGIRLVVKDYDLPSQGDENDDRLKSDEDGDYIERIFEGD